MAIFQILSIYNHVHFIVVDYWVFYVLVTSKVISGQLLTCDIAHTFKVLEVIGLTPPGTELLIFHSRDQRSINLAIEPCTLHSAVAIVDQLVATMA